MIYLTGDTHGDIKGFNERMKKARLSEDDILIVLGDFGFSWDGETRNAWLRERRPYRVLFVDGNHENYTWMKNMETVDMYGDSVAVFGGNTYRLLTGHMYTIEGKRFFVFGGASSIDKDYRTDPAVTALWGKSWWKEEVPSYERLDEAFDTLRRNGWKFDYFLSHTTSPGEKRRMFTRLSLSFFDPVESMIRALEEEIENKGGGWKESFFGHFHEDADDGKYHCLMNRAVALEETGRKDEDA